MYDNEYETMKNQNRTGLKNFKPKINLNHSRDNEMLNQKTLFFTFSVYLFLVVLLFSQ